MKRLLVLWLVLALGNAALPQPEDAAETQAQAGSEHAECILKIVYAPDVLPLDMETLDALVRSSGVAVEAGQRVLGASADAAAAIPALEPLQSPHTFTSGTQGMYVRLTIGLVGHSRPPRAQEYMLAIIENLQQALERTYQQHREFHTRMLERHAKQAAQAEERYAELQAQLRQLTETGSLERQDIMMELSRVRERIAALEMEKSRDEVMANEWAKRMDEVKQRTQERIDNDPVLKQLQRLVKSAEGRMAQVKKMHEAGTVSQSELQAAEENLIRAQLELSRRQAELVGQSTAGSGGFAGGGMGGGFGGGMGGYGGMSGGRMGASGGPAENHGRASGYEEGGMGGYGAGVMYGANPYGADEYTGPVAEYSRRLQDLATRERQRAVEMPSLLEQQAQAQLRLQASEQYEILTLKLELARENLRQALLMKQQLEMAPLIQPEVIAIGAQ